MKALILGGILLLDLYFLFHLLRDVRAHRSETAAEPGHPLALAVYTFFLFFCSTFGIPDFPISSTVYPRLKWLPDRKLPGTLVCESVIPCAFMALGYLTFTSLDIWTLSLPIIAQLAGSWIGPKISMRLPERKIKACIAVGLLLAGIMLLLSKLSLIPAAGQLNSFTGWRLVLCVLLSFACGILNNIGVGSFSVMLALLYVLGLSSISAYPIMMGAAALATPVGGAQFVRGGSYGRRIVLFSTVFGSIGACFAIFVVRNMDLSILQWIIMVILFYSAFSTGKGVLDARRAEHAPENA